MQVMSRPSYIDVAETATLPKLSSKRCRNSRAIPRHPNGLTQLRILPPVTCNHCKDCSVDVEVLAVAKIQKMIGRCPHLKAILASNDKTPFTDGHIDIYGGLGQKKSDWLGRVSVQIKGRTRTRKQTEMLTFGISRTDLTGFQKDSGVLYIYVAVDRHGRCVPYYAILSQIGRAHV